jgi:hypothetical protein
LPGVQKRYYRVAERVAEMPEKGRLVMVPLLVLSKSSASPLKVDQVPSWNA